MCCSCAQDVIRVHTWGLWLTDRRWFSCESWTRSRELCVLCMTCCLSFEHFFPTWESSAERERRKTMKNRRPKQKQQRTSLATTNYWLKLKPKSASRCGTIVETDVDTSSSSHHDEAIIIPSTRRVGGSASYLFTSNGYSRTTPKKTNLQVV